MSLEEPIARGAAALLLLLVLCASATEAGQAPRLSNAGAPAKTPFNLPADYDGPSPPAAPDVISRDATGRATVRAVRVAERMHVDGRLDEAVYSNVPAMSGFYQMEPDWRAPASQRTDVWLFFDDVNLYATARVWESSPDRMVIDEWRHDSTGIFQNECIGFLFDTFYDRRNGVVFNINPAGARAEAQVTDERDWNADWTPVWNVGVGRFEGGWTVEIAVPFKSLRYKPQREQVWGFNVQRQNRWKNELSFLVPLPRAWQSSGIVHPSQAATLVGIEVPGAAKNIEVKPYVSGRATTDRVSAAPAGSTLHGQWGADVKYAVTRGLTADLTYNTDFAQAEADQQQTNLTRFSLLFPEKRDFFLENRGLFTFGGVGNNTPVLFYSRQIGLNQGRVVPIDGGGRLTGRVGPFSIGALSIRQDEDVASGTRPTTFSVARVRRDAFGHGTFGVIFTDRSVARSGPGANDAFGADGQFLFLRNLAVNAYWARTHAAGGNGNQASYRGQIDYEGDRYGLQVERLVVGDGFNPEIGFVPRTNMRRLFAQPRFSIRPSGSKVVRKYNYMGWLDYIENGTARLETRQRHAEFSVDFQSSDRLRLFFDNNHELVLRPFVIGPNVRVPLGNYDFNVGHVEYVLGQQRKLTGAMSVERGSFYGGEKTSLGVAASRLKLTGQFSIEPGITINRVVLPQQAFTTRLVTANTIYAMTPLMFATALLQYNSDSHSVSANVRLRWEYRPRSELFVVYNEQRDTLLARYPELQNRAFMVKVTRLFGF